MSDRPFAYVCSPFRGDAEGNAKRAREYCRQVYDAGYAPLAPHIYFPQFLKDADPKEREAGMAMGAALLPLCRVLLVCGDRISEDMKQEIQLAKNLGVETCTLENIPPISTLANYRDDLTGLDNLNIAMSLIEGMTGSRFRFILGDSFIMPDSESYFAINKLSSFSREDMRYHVSFNANLQKMGISMDVGGLLQFQQETERVRELLTLLDSRRYALAPEEMDAFNDSIKQREGARAAPAKDEEKPSVLRQIAEARDKEKAAAKPKRDKKPKSREEEL